MAAATWIRLVVVTMAATMAVAPMQPNLVERYYSRGLYPALQQFLTPLANMVGVALFDVALVLGIGGLVTWWVMRLAQSRGRRIRVGAGLAGQTLVLAAAVYLVFLASWGLNYRRVRLRDAVGMEPARVTSTALRGLADRSVGALNVLHGAAHAAGWPALDQLPQTLRPSLEQALERVGGGPAPAMGLPKPTWMTWYFRRASIDGMIDPFFLEILVNDRVLPFERPFLVAHETAHLAGYADEGEASFLGWVACQRGEVSLQYSGWLYLLPQTLRHLDAPTRDEVLQPLGAGPREDLEAIADRLREAVPVISRGAQRAYDQFLKANRVEEGIQSYGTVVDLILGTGMWK